MSIEGLGVFYLGRRYDAEARKPTSDLVLYDSRDLVTHGLAVGMTGSGKTGLGIAIIEEAAIDGVPVIVIDPKGDLTNLLLTFPDLRPEDFEPWVNGDDAERAGKSKQEFATDQAARWKQGLAECGEDGARIRRLKEAAEFALYTPGSTAGVAVSVLSSFTRPLLDDPELIRERAQTTVSSLLALAGVEGEPLKSREHILLSTILLSAWQAGKSPDLASLIAQVRQPPMARVGVIDVESFFPAKDRFQFAMAINALLASPGFEVWSQGEPLDVSALLRTASGKPRVSIFSLAHIEDPQRMFFVSLLLGAVAGWTRAQSGTSSLRALLYMDEIFGFFPPVANPPSKTPLLTLLKQGRAAGLGVVLATQNPVDLDYKGLSNIGTWWLGRLQTDRDKARLLDGLESASDAAFDRDEVDRLLSALSSRVFLMRNVHENGLTLLQTRWALSYLRGPLGREEIRRLVGERPRSAPTEPRAFHVIRQAGDTAESGSTMRPIVPPDIPQYFAPDAGEGLLEALVYGAASVRFVDQKLRLDETRLVTCAARLVDGAVPLDWTIATRVEWPPEQLELDAPEGAIFRPVLAAALKRRNYDAWSRQLAATLVATQSIELLRSPQTDEVSRPGESERDFRERLQQASREVRDRKLDELRRKYAPRQASLDDRLRRAQQVVERETGQATGQKLQTAISVGATLMSALLGRKSITAGTIGRATTAARGVGRTMREAEDINRAKQNLAAVEDQRRQLEADLRAEVTAIEAVTNAGTEPLDRIVLKPKKSNIAVKTVALVWANG